MSTEDSSTANRGSGSNDQLGAGFNARKQERGAAHELLLLASVLIAAVSALIWIFRTAHADEPMLRSECEARGGMLIRTQSPLYTCAGKPASAPANR